MSKKPTSSLLVPAARNTCLSALVFLAVVLPALAVAQTTTPAAQPVAQELRFRDIFQMPVGARGLEPSAAVKALNGKRIRITGYMVAQEDAAPGRFFLTPVPLRMSEHADGDADDLPPNAMVVFMPPAEQVKALPHTAGLLQLTGTLLWGRHVLDDGRVTWLRLQLEPRPAAAAAAASSQPSS